MCKLLVGRSRKLAVRQCTLCCSTPRYCSLLCEMRDWSTHSCTCLSNIGQPHPAAVEFVAQIVTQFGTHGHLDRQMLLSTCFYAHDFWRMHIQPFIVDWLIFDKFEFRTLAHYRWHSLLQALLAIPAILKLTDMEMFLVRAISAYWYATYHTAAVRIQTRFRLLCMQD